MARMHRVSAPAAGTERTFPVRYERLDRPAAQQRMLVSWATRALATLLTVGAIVVSVSAAEAQNTGSAAPQFVNPLDRLKGTSPYEEYQKRRDARVKDNFAQLDANQDNQLTEREIQNYRRRLFRQRDLDRDRTLREGEFIAYRDAKTGKFLNYEQYLRTQRGYYNIDRDHNRVVTREEFMRVGQIYFARLDRNRDGIVTFEEYNADPTARGFLQR